MFNRLKLVTLLLVPALMAEAKEGPKNEFRENLKECITVKKAGEGWFIGPAVGAQIYVGEFDNYQPLGYRISTAVEGQLGKWITPAIAVRLRGTGARTTGGSISKKREKMNIGYIQADCMVDALNLLIGVNEERRFTFVPFVGIGAATNFTRDITGFALTAGGQGLYRATERVSMFAELKGTLLNEKTDGFVGGVKGEGSAMMTVGLLLNF